MSIDLTFACLKPTKHVCSRGSLLLSICCATAAIDNRYRHNTDFSMIEFYTCKLLHHPTVKKEHMADTAALVRMLPRRRTAHETIITGRRCVAEGGRMIVSEYLCTTASLRESLAWKTLSKRSCVYESGWGVNISVMG